MKSIFCMLSFMVVGAAFTFGADKKHSSSQTKSSQHDTNPAAARTQTNNSKPDSTKRKHQSSAVTMANVKAMDTNHDNRVTREEFIASPLGKQHPELTDKIFAKSKGKDKAVTSYRNSKISSWISTNKRATMRSSEVARCEILAPPDALCRVAPIALAFSYFSLGRFGPNGQ